MAKDGIEYEFFMYEDHSIAKGGKLPNFERGAHACWYYLICAHANLESVQEGATYEGEMDTVNALNNIARSVAMQYRLDSPDDFLKFMPVCVDECMRIGKPFDPRVLKPWNEEYRRTMN